MDILYYTRPNFKNWRFKYYKKPCYSAIREKITKRQKINFNIFIFYEFKNEFNKPGFVKRSEFINGVIKYDFKLSRDRVLYPQKKRKEQKLLSIIKTIMT